MSAPRLSVLIPVYNGGPFLAECIESVLAQDFTDYELLISDDCSTDGTRAVIERFAARDRRIRWWANPVNRGQVANVNRCLREARGEFIKFVFADDKLLEPSALRRLAAILEADSSVSLVGSASQLIDAGSRTIQTRRPFSAAGTWPGFSMILRCLEPDFCWKNFIGEPTVVMFRKGQAARGFDPRYLQLVDLEMWIYLLEQGRLAYLAEPFSAFRQHPNQQSEVNRRCGANVAEHSRLLLDVLAKPWLRKTVNPEILFNQIYRLQKTPGDQDRVIVSEMMKILGRDRYAYYWLRRKISRPIKKLETQLRNIHYRTAVGPEP
jgi:glycosyltransferase involved in cell wall biosynthesis